MVGLHHSGVPEMKDGQILTIRGTPWDRSMPDSDIHWIANEGVRVSVICKNLTAARVKPEYQPALASLVTTFGENSKPSRCRKPNGGRYHGPTMIREPRYRPRNFHHRARNREFLYRPSVGLCCAATGS